MARDVHALTTINAAAEPKVPAPRRHRGFA